MHLYSSFWLARDLIHITLPISKRQGNPRVREAECGRGARMSARIVRVLSPSAISHISIRPIST